MIAEEDFRVEEEFKKRGDQVHSCTQYKKIDAVGYLLVPLNRIFEKQKHTKKDSLELLQLSANSYLPVCSWILCCFIL